MCSEAIRRLPAATASVPEDAGARLSYRCDLLAGRLADLLREAFPARPEGLAGPLAFLDERRAAAGRVAASRSSQAQADPFDRLARALGLSEVEIDLVLLAGLAEEHEGFADLLRTLHPEGRPWACAGLAAQLLAPSAEERRALRQTLLTGAAARSGLLRLEGDGPLFVRSLRLADRLWPVLAGVDRWPEGVRARADEVATAGLEEWLATPSVAGARKALSQARAITLIVRADPVATAVDRAAALVASAGLEARRLELGSVTSGAASSSALASQAALSLHCLCRSVVPVLVPPPIDGPGARPVAGLEDHPGPVVLCVGQEQPVATRRPRWTVECDRLGPTAWVEMWRHTLPELADEATQLAAAFPLEPAQAARVARDLELRSSENSLDLAAVAAGVRGRVAVPHASGVDRIRANAGWDRLVLAPRKLGQLHEAVDRLHHQARVLDDWGFLSGRRGARGVRMLLAGPPGTGKSLSAEVLATALGVDLLRVDLARVVSKWIGETEKNLAAVFDAAERARSVLLFDEADALFGKRTEVRDAHDRYANLETAYLLTRLESFEGLAVLSTNLRQNLDDAFTRRLEFIVEYREPDAAERCALWLCHLPEGAPLAADVDFEELAEHYPMVGGNIRNAVVAAAFLAASEGGELGRRHFLRAIRREYEKTGKAFPGYPAGGPDPENGELTPCRP